MIEEHFIRAMNSERSNNNYWFLYADWLEEQGKEYSGQLIRRAINHWKPELANSNLIVFFENHKNVCSILRYPRRIYYTICLRSQRKEAKFEVMGNGTLRWSSDRFLAWLLILGFRNGLKEIKRLDHV